MFVRLLCKPINAEVTRHNGPALHSLTADLSVGLCELIEAVFDQRHSTASLYGFHLPIENVLPEYTEVCSLRPFSVRFFYQHFTLIFDYFTQVVETSRTTVKLLHL